MQKKILFNIYLVGLIFFDFQAIFQNIRTKNIKPPKTNILKKENKDPVKSQKANVPKKTNKKKSEGFFRKHLKPLVFLAIGTIVGLYWYKKKSLGKSHHNNLEENSYDNLIKDDFTEYGNLFYANVNLINQLKNKLADNSEDQDSYDQLIMETKLLPLIKYQAMLVAVIGKLKDGLYDKKFIDQNNQNQTLEHEKEDILRELSAEAEDTALDILDVIKLYQPESFTDRLFFNASMYAFKKVAHYGLDSFVDENIVKKNTVVAEPTNEIGFLMKSLKTIENFESKQGN